MEQEQFRCEPKFGITKDHRFIVMWNRVADGWVTEIDSVIPADEVIPFDASCTTFAAALKIAKAMRADRQYSVQEGMPKPNTLNELHDVYSKRLAIESDWEAVEIICSAMLDRQITGDPLWLWVVAASGSTKSEILRSLCGLPQVFQLSSLTSKTIVSGKERRDGSVVKGLFSKMNGRVVVVPELSQVLSKSREERDAIFAQLRDLYDGFCVYGFGTIDEPITVTCRIGLVAGVTPAIDMFGSVHAVLGERFLKVRPKFNRDLARNQALENKDVLEAMRMELAAANKYYFQHLPADQKPPGATGEQKIRIGLYADFVAFLRTTVTSQGFREYDTSEWQPEPEFSTRLSQQLLKLGQCVARFRGHTSLTRQDMNSISRVALDTCIPNRLAIVRALDQTSENLNIAQIAKKTGLSYQKTRNSLERLAVIGGIVTELSENQEYNQRQYQLDLKFRELLTKIKKQDAGAYIEDISQ